MADRDEAEVLRASMTGQTFLYKGEEYSIALAGAYQKENAVVALRALELLNDLGYPTTVVQRQNGLKNTAWPGRFALLGTKPDFVVDGAHNPAAADMLAASIERYFKDRRIIYIMGMFRDKDYRSVIQKTEIYAAGSRQLFRRQCPRIIRCCNGQDRICIFFRLLDHAAPVFIPPEPEVPVLS